MRTLVIGDVHGGLKALEQCLERCKYNSEEDKLIFLGDYVDGWSESSQVVNYLLELELTSKITPIFIKGNHDAWCREWLVEGRINPIWQQQGGQATIDSYVKNVMNEVDLLKEHRHFFDELLLTYYVDEENRAFVHGGFNSELGLGHENFSFDYYWNRDMWIKAVTLNKSNNPYKEVYIGHSSTGFYKIKPHLPEYQIKEQPKQGNIIVPMNRGNIWNLDTGGGFEGKLTIMDIDTKEFWQSDYVKDLYKDEYGRI